MKTRRKGCHTSTYKGKRVLVRLRDGRYIVDRFMDKKRGKIFLKDFGEVTTEDLLTMSIYRWPVREPGKKDEEK